MPRLQEYEAAKDPDSIIDYGRNWGDNLESGDKGFLGLTEEIVTSEWEITSDTENPPTLVIAEGGTGISDDLKSTSVFLKGGTSGIYYKLTNKIVTYDDNSVNRTEEMTGVIKCCHK